MSGTALGLGAQAPTFSVTPQSYNFGSVAIGSESSSQTFTVTNTGGLTLDISAVALSGGDAAQFRLSDDGCTGAHLTGGQTCTVNAKLAPSIAGTPSANIAFTHNTFGSPSDVPLTGAAVGGGGPGAVSPPVDPLTVTPPTTPTNTTTTPETVVAVTPEQLIKLPSSKKCFSRRNFRITLQESLGVKISQAEVTVTGKKTKIVRGKGLSAPVNLTGLPKGRFTVTVKAKLLDGREIVGTRKYRTCTKKMKGGKVKL